MCNPRRVEVTATRQVRESWEREVRRLAEVGAHLTGAARIRQALDDSVGAPALMALQTRLAGGCEGWEEQEDGSYRHLVEGGEVIYQPAGHTLEILATVDETIRATGEASERISGELDESLSATAQGRYYDDGYAGTTETSARRQAQEAAESRLRETIQGRLEQAADTAEQARAADLAARAEAQARRRLAERGAERRPELDRRAQEALQEVGIRARQAFHRLLALAYRDALLGMARRRGAAAADIRTTETDEYLEIDLLLPD